MSRREQSCGRPEPVAALVHQPPAAMRCPRVATGSHRRRAVGVAVRRPPTPGAASNPSPATPVHLAGHPGAATGGHHRMLTGRRAPSAGLGSSNDPRPSGATRARRSGPCFPEGRNGPARPEGPTRWRCHEQQRWQARQRPATGRKSGRHAQTMTGSSRPRPAGASPSRRPDSRCGSTARTGPSRNSLHLPGSPPCLT